MRHQIGIGIVAVAAFGFLAFIVSDHHSEAVREGTVSLRSSSIAAKQTSERPEVESSNVAEVADYRSAAGSALSWADLLKMSSNYADFLDRALPAASNGDASAQFAIYEALAYCEDGYRGFFDRPGKRRTLDEALMWASTLSVDMDWVRDVHRRCEALMARGTGEIGRPETWLGRASAAEFPPAQARKALLELHALDRQSKAQTDRTASTAKESEEKTASARALALKALAAGDPSATWDAADTIYYLTGSISTANTEQWVWRMAACIQGYDCAPGADWVVALCRYDPTPCSPGESGTEIIRRAWMSASADGVTSDLELRARQLADRLNSGQFGDDDLKKFMDVGGTSEPGQ